LDNPGNIKIEDKNHEPDTKPEAEINARTVVRSFILLTSIVLVGLVIIFGIDKYNSYNTIKQIKDYIAKSENTLTSQKPQSVAAVENIELDLTRFRDDNIDNKDLTDKINSILHHLQDLPVYVRIGTQVRSWATSEIIRTETDSVIALYKDKNNYTFKTQYLPTTPIETRAFDLQRAHPDWTKDDCLRIANRKLWAGMSKVQLQAAWGQPKSIDKNYTYGSNSEQWVYGSMGPYVYVENGIVTSWQE
jgi:hypothetical protein